MLITAESRTKSPIAQKASVEKGMFGSELPGTIFFYCWKWNRTHNSSKHGTREHNQNKCLIERGNCCRKWFFVRFFDEYGRCQFRFVQWSIVRDHGDTAGHPIPAPYSAHLFILQTFQTNFYLFYFYILQKMSDTCQDRDLMRNKKEKTSVMIRWIKHW